MQELYGITYTIDLVLKYKVYTVIDLRFCMNSPLLETELEAKIQIIFIWQI